MTNCPAVLFGAPMPATPTIPHSGVWGTGTEKPGSVATAGLVMGVWGNQRRDGSGASRAP